MTRTMPLNRLALTTLSVLIVSAFSGAPSVRAHCDAICRLAMINHVQSQGAIAKKKTKVQISASSLKKRR